MEHRGPDRAICYESFDNMQLGHNRLKILDLDDRSNQPFTSADGAHVVIFNGEIYNYRELAKKHQLLLKTTSDTEVIVELFTKLGPSMLKEFNGMFSIIIVNKKTKSIFIARDRLGVKPIYIYRHGQYITVASEIAAILELMDKIDFDPIGIRQYRKLRTFFNGHTLYKNIEMFPAGYYYLNSQTTPYWKLPYGTQKPPTDHEIRDLVTSAVNYRCISDVPVGSYLSGGLDSTIVAGLADKPYTWTIGFSGFNEFEWGRLASAHFKSKHSEILITNEEFVELAKFMINKRKEPLSVPNEVLIYKMTKAVKEKNTVILSGEGADELFFGYDRIFRWASQNQWDIQEFDRLYSYGSHSDNDILEDVLAPFQSYGRLIDIIAAFFQIAHLHGLLQRLDYATMLCSVEARVPFVDYRLIERMAGVPFEFRMPNNVIKAPLKRAFKDLVPIEIIERKKVGFPVPLEKLALGKRNEIDNPMDSWLNFNLETMGIDINEWKSK